MTAPSTGKPASPPVLPSVGDGSDTGAQRAPIPPATHDAIEDDPIQVDQKRKRTLAATGSTPNTFEKTEGPRGLLWRSLSGLAIPGSIFTVIGGMLLYQNLTGHWESWSYGWTVILMAVGLGIFLMGTRGANADQRQSGLQLIRLGLILFIIFGSFFELLFTAGEPMSVRSVFFPAALILLGLYLLLSRSGLFGSRIEPSIEDPEVSYKEET